MAIDLWGGLTALINPYVRRDPGALPQAGMNRAFSAPLIGITIIHGLMRDVYNEVGLRPWLICETPSG